MTGRLRMDWRVGACALLAMLAGTGCDSSRPAAVRIGDPIPALSLEGLDGGLLHSADWLGRTVVLNIWATWCPPCREEMPALQRLSRALDPAQYGIVGLSLDTDRNLVREFALQHGLTFPLAIDPDGHSSKAALGVWVLPDTLIIGPDGRLADRVVGGADWASAALRSRVAMAHARSGDGAVGRVALRGRPVSRPAGDADAVYPPRP